MMEIYALGVGHNTPVFIDLAESCGYIIKGLYHYDSSKTGLEDYGFPVLGSFEDLLLEDSLEGMNFILTMGNSVIRTELSDKIRSMGGAVPTLIHPSSVISRFADVSDVGVYIGPFTYIQANSSVGDNTVILSHVNISHDTSVGNSVFIAGGSMIGAYTKIEDYAFVGQHVTSISGKVNKIGSHSYVGAGALLTSDVRENTIVAGFPAKEITRTTCI